MKRNKNYLLIFNFSLLNLDLTHLLALIKAPCLVFAKTPKPLPSDRSTLYGKAPLSLPALSEPPFCFFIAINHNYKFNSLYTLLFKVQSMGE